MAANVHGVDDAALYWAAKGGWADIVQLLLDRGANPFAANSRALIAAIESGDEDTLRVLRKPIAEAGLGRTIPTQGSATPELF